MTSFTDAFTRADGAIGTGWTTGVGGTTPMSIASNAAVPNNPGQDCYAVRTGETYANDQTSKGNLSEGSTAGGGEGIALIVRCDSVNLNCYRGAFNHGATNSIEVGRLNAGAFASIAVRTVTWVDGDEMSLDVSGSVGSVVLKILRNGVQQGANITDASGSGIASGSPGIAYSSVGVSSQVLSWTGTDGGSAPVNFTASLAATGSLSAVAHAGVTEVAVGAVATAVSGDVTVNYPTGVGEVLTGDIIVCDVSQRDNVVDTFPAGWTKKAEANNGTGLRKTIAWKRRAGGDSDTSVVVTHTAGAQIIARVHVIRGAVASGDPFEATGGPTSVSASATGTFPNVTTLSAGALLLYSFAYQDDFATAPAITNAQGLTLTERDSTEVP